jgi:3-oxoacyl-[acyl-carrier-protein] synthase II
VKKRIVITGMGTKNAIGGNVSEFARSLREGVCGISQIDLFDTTDFRTHKGGQVKDFDPRRSIPEEFSLKRISRADALSMAAALEALTDAGLYPLQENIKENMGIAIGGGAGGLLEAESFYADLLRKGKERSKYSQLSSLFCASSADRIASSLEFSGPRAMPGT